MRNSHSYFCKEMILYTKFKELVRSCVLGLSLAVVSVAIVPTPALAQNAAPSAAAASTVAAIPELKTDASGAVKNPDAADNPYGPVALWNSSDAVARAVLLLLAVMSLGSWYIFAVKVLEQRKVGTFSREAADKFWAAGTVAQGAGALNQDSPYQFIAAAGLEATKKHSGLMEHIPLHDWISMSIQRSVDRVNREMQGGLSFLATVGSISPFVGLFGTVWGIYHALTAIGKSGQASIDKVAGPVGEALIMTAFGLAVAVPAVLAYNYLISRNKSVMDDIRSFGSDLHSVLLGTASKT